jgi:hypothetical protein
MVEALYWEGKRLYGERRWAEAQRMFERCQDSVSRTPGEYHHSTKYIEICKRHLEDRSERAYRDGEQLQGEGAWLQARRLHCHPHDICLCRHPFGIQGLTCLARAAGQVLL